jgi:hypothetical protein
MNIFEIFQTEGSIDQSLLAGIVQYQNYWLAIKEMIDGLFRDLQFSSNSRVSIEQALSELWLSIYQQCEKLVTVVVEYYRSKAYSYADKFEQALQSTYLP